MRRAVPWRAWSAWLLAVASLMLVFEFFIWHNDALPAADKVSWALGNVPSLAFVTVGTVIVARRPGNRIGWLCYGVGLGQILASFASQTAASALAASPRPAPVRLVAYELGELCWELSWALLALLLLLFPKASCHRLAGARSPGPAALSLSWPRSRLPSCPSQRPLAGPPTRSPFQPWKACSASPTHQRASRWLG